MSAYLTGCLGVVFESFNGFAFQLLLPFFFSFFYAITALALIAIADKVSFQDFLCYCKPLLFLSIVGSNCCQVSLL
jgi:hypothetical protein